MLRKIKLKAHPGKSIFASDVVEYLGHNVSRYGISPHEAKVAAVTELRIPSDVKELRSVLGFMNYYRGYVPEYSAIARPLNDLLQNDTPYVWGSEQQYAYDRLKKELTSEGRALRRLDPELPILLYTDWSKQGIGAVLAQKDADGQEYMCACISRSLNKHEKEYLVTVDKLLTDTAIMGMANGVPMLGVTTRKCRIVQEGAKTFRVVLVQGLNRQIRRMCEHFGYEVMKLERVRIMHISLKGLPVGDWRDLTKGEKEELYKLIEKSEPNEAEIVMTKGSVFSLMNEPEKAIIELKKAVPMVDEDELEEIFTSIAFEYEKIDKFDHALVYLKKALFQTPGSESLMYEIGMCFSMGQRLEEAVEFFQIQTDQNPYSIPAWYNLGLSYFQLELYEKSIDAFEFVLSIDDRYTQAYQSMAHAYASIENFEKAIEVYFESFEFEQPDAMTYYYIGECYEKMKDALNALEYYRKSIEIDPLLADPWAGIGALLDEQGDCVVIPMRG
jgi:pseudouridine synthase